jgi:hypothetical protein
MNFTKNVDTAISVYVEFYISKDMNFSANADVKIGSYNGQIDNSSQSIAKNIFMPNFIFSGSYYIIAKYRAGDDSNSFFTNVSVYVTQIPSLVTIAGVSLNNTAYYEGNNANLTISYTSNLSVDRDVTFEVFFSNDSAFSGFLDNNSVTTFDKIINSNGSLEQDFRMPFVSVTGIYYLILRAYYNDPFGVAYLNTIKKQLTIKSLLDVVTISGPILTKTLYSTKEQIPFRIGINNPTSKASGSVIYYLSSDTIIDNSDISYLYEPTKLDFYTGFNPFDLYASNNLETSPGTYYLLANLSIGGSIKKLQSPLITIHKLISTISGLSITGSDLKLSSSNSFDYSIDRVPISMDISFYFSLDKTWSSSDYLIDTKSTSPPIQPLLYRGSLDIPSSTPDGTYYLTAKYTPNSDDTYYEFSSNTLTIDQNLVLLFRDTQNTQYSTMYLFIDDVYIETFTNYNSSTPSCDQLNGFSANSYTIYSGTPGNHTYKTRSINSLSTGVTIKSGGFVVFPSSCTSVDID